MNRSINTKKITLWVVVIIAFLAAWNYFLSITYTGDAQIWTWPIFFIEITLYVVFGLGGFLGLTSGRYVGAKHVVGRALFFLGLASISLMAGFIIWDYYAFILKVDETPYPSIADFLFVLNMPLLAIGLAMLIKVYSIKIDKRYIFEALLVFVVAFSAITFFYGGLPELAIGAPITNFIEIAYSVSDAIFISLGFMVLRIAGGKIFRGLFVYTLGLFALASADLTFAYRFENDLFYDGDISDILYIITGLLFSAGIYYTIQAFISTRDSLQTKNLTI